MNRTVDLLVTDLRSLTLDMGAGGGLVSPAVYDTALVARFHHPAEGPTRALDWLLSQQAEDGGFGDPSVPLARDVPTLAAVLAFRANSGREQAEQAGLSFLRRQQAQWRAPLPEDIPIGVELVLPWLLDEAARMGIPIPREPYAALTELGQRRRSLIAQLKPEAGTTPIHSWEAWGTDPDSALLDRSGGIGHSPSATAAWLHARSKISALTDDASRAAKRYLEQAGAATGTGIPGVVPTVWPIGRFEQLFLPYALLLTGLLERPLFREMVAPVLEDIERALEAGGLGFSDHFAPDGDDTAAGLAVLLATGRRVDLTCLRRFENGEHFCTWRHELAPSLSATARAVHTLSLGGEEVERHRAFLIQRQSPDGRWVADKWNGSWLYATCHSVAALASSATASHRAAVERALHAVIASQRADGGWGMAGASTATETAYAVLTLYAAHAHARDAGTRAALDQARRWLLNDYRPLAMSGVACWIGKEAYRPYRVDQAFETIALLALSLEQTIAA